MQITRLFNKTLRAFNDENIRMIVSYGGSSSSKTISIMQILLLYALKNPNKRITIISETLPKVKKTVLKDFQKVVLVTAQLNIQFMKYFNKTELIYSLPNGTEIQFISADSESKIIGMRTDILYLDEINHIKKNIFDQLSIRTKEKILCSYNPASKFYIMEEFDRDDVVVIHSTYKDNQFVSAEIIKELIEKGRKNKNFKRVYLDGKIGVSEGLIFEEDLNYIVSPNPNKKIKQIIFGLDFGYQDPTALVKVIIYENKEIYVEELIYQNHMTGEQIIKKLRSLRIDKTQLIVCDSARPELIQSIRNAGYNTQSVKKTKVMDGISNLLDYLMFVNKFSSNIITELQNYVWAKNKTGEKIDAPIDNWNHIIDAIRYALTRVVVRTHEETITEF